MAGGTLCCIVAVKTANLCKRRGSIYGGRVGNCFVYMIGQLEEFSVKLLVSSQHCHDAGEDCMQVVAKGPCLERLLGIPLHQLLV